MDYIQPGPFQKALDLGCGTGELTREFHQRFQIKQTYGLDSSLNMLNKAKAFAGEGLAFGQGDLRKFPGNDYDVVISNAAIQWVENHPKVIKNISEALKPGGQMCIQMPANHDFVTHTLAREMGTSSPWISLLRAPSSPSSVLRLAEYAHLLFTLGFQEQKVEMKVYGHVLESREDVVEWMKGTTLTHFKSNLSEAQYGEFLKEYRERLFVELPNVRPFFYPFKRLFLWGRK